MLTSQLTTLSIPVQIQYNKKTILIKSIKHGLFLCESLVKMSLLKNKIISKNVPKYINLKKDSNN